MERAGGQAIAELHLIRDDGDERLVTRGGLNLHYPDGPSDKPEFVIPAEPVQATVELYPTAFILESGAELRLTLRTHDSNQWYNPDPHVAQITAQLGEETALTLPLIETDDTNNFMKSCGRLLENLASECSDST